MKWTYEFWPTQSFVFWVAIIFWGPSFFYDKMVKIVVGQILKASTLSDFLKLVEFKICWDKKVFAKSE